MPHESREFLRINQLLVALTTLLIGLLGYFLTRFVSEVDAHSARISRLEGASATLTKLAEKYDLRIDRLDDRLRTVEVGR